jgi:hypothetical protein
MRKHLRDYFIPHEGNDYKPHSLQKAAMTGMVILVLLSFTLANVQSLLWVASDWMVSTILPAVIVDLTNDERSGVALGQLTRSTALDAAAQLKAQHMAEKEYFAHFSPDGVSPWFWFAQANYNFVHAGENLAIHFTDTEELVDAWMDSPTHRANIVNGDYTEIGIGTAAGRFEGYKTVYVVQLFGAPAAPTTAQAAEPEPQAQPEPTPEVVGEVASSGNTEAVSADSDDSDGGETFVLAQAVGITEDVEIIQAQPEPVAEVSKELPSSFMSTSTGGVPASTDSTQVQDGTDASTPYFYKVLTQPHVTLQVTYVAVGFLVLISLLFSIGIEIRRHHPIQIAYSLALLLLMFGLFQLHEILSAGVVIV